MRPVHRFRGEMERGHPGRRRHGTRVRARREQNAYDCAVSPLASDVQSRVATDARLRLDPRTRTEQNLGELEATLLRGQVQGAQPVPLGHVRIGPLREQRTHRRHVTTPCRVKEWIF